MKRVSCRLILLHSLLLISFCAITAQTIGFEKIRWVRDKIAPGLIWKSSHTFIYDTIPQNINVLIVNPGKRKVSLVYNPEKNIPVSIQAFATPALAAVNGGFFNIKNGGSATYIRTGGSITYSDASWQLPENENINGSVLIRSGREVIIEKAKSDSWYDNKKEFDDVLAAGPLLVKEGNIPVLPATSLVTARHPRTAIGVMKSRRILLVTLDGRTTEAAGVTLNELALLMKSLGSRDAVNLDGGGSTTMWIRGRSFNGVVNMPCDNKKFDHEGERAVSDIFIVK